LESLLLKDKTCNIIANYLQSFLNISKNEDFKECMSVWHNRSSKFSIGIT
jgi:hypothetical protein